MTLCQAFPLVDVDDSLIRVQMPASMPSTDSLLESLIRALRYVPDRAAGIRSAGDLPACLRARTRMRGREAWKAWGDHTYIWFVTAERIASTSSEPALLARFFDMDGRCMAKGIWRLGESAGWLLEAPCV